MVDPRKLLVYVGSSTMSGDPVNLPTRVEAGYVPPNPDGSTKNCKNCWKWVPGVLGCREMSGATVSGEMICVLHSYGAPTDVEVSPSEGMLTPEELGLELVPAGTSCSSCAAYDDGFCRLIQDEGSYALVEPLACCNRWTPRGG